MPANIDEVIKVEKLTKIYDFEGTEATTVLDDVSFVLHRGESLGFIGESGSGKSILMKCIGARGRVTKGKIYLNGKNITHRKMKFLVKRTQRKIQTVTQIANMSFELDKHVDRVIADALVQSGIKRSEAKLRVPEVLSYFGLDPDYADMFPYELSGGQCQRVALAKCLTVNPEVVIFDEALSSLDSSSQIALMNIIKEEKEKRNLSYMIISHDLRMISELCDRVLVMQEGKIVEEGTPEEIINNPKLPYTKELVDNLMESVF
ncbi:MAG: ATP-binding cassette domain-containing protein [Clostridia bacterium]|nr:ATP-binding cassette domain-containing protein [Clostridia bacterium]